MFSELEGENWAELLTPIVGLIYQHPREWFAAVGELGTGCDVGDDVAGFVHE